MPSSSCSRYVLRVVVACVMYLVPSVGQAQPAVVVESLSVPGLMAAVEVRRDRWGVPHIYAKNQRDLDRG